MNQSGSVSAEGEGRVPGEGATGVSAAGQVREPRGCAREVTQPENRLTATGTDEPVSAFSVPQAASLVVEH